MKLKYLLACSVVCAVATSVNAAESIDWGELQPDVIYNYEAMAPAMGTFTPSETGLIRCYSSGSQIVPYKEASHETPIESSNSYYGDSGVKVRVYEVTAGQTLYFYNSFPLDGGTFRISTGNEAVELIDVTPAANGSHVSLSTSYNVSLSFNVPVKCTKCILSVNDATAEVTPSVSNSYIDVNWYNTLLNWYNERKINYGDVLTMTITGVRDAYDSSNRPDFGYGVGKIVLNFTMAAKPAELIRESGTPNSGAPDFLTYYLPGGDEGLVKLVFDQDLDSRCHTVAELTYGDRDNIELGMYIENPPVTIEGKTVTVNLQGVTRFPEEMVPGLAAQKFIELRISGIKSSDGQYVLTGYPSSPYSFGYAYNLKSVVYSIAADWVPVAGSMLNSGEEMEMWVLNGQKIIFDSVDFSYIKDGVSATVSVPYSDLKASVDSDNDMLYNFVSPAIDADADTDITVTLGGLICADGLDHSSDIFVRYKAASAAVDSIQTADGDRIFYDLTGRRVFAPSKGIYICNGKKIVISK